MVARVGIFDSGVGGLSVAAALHRQQPSLQITYIADTAFFPYGGRADAEVAERALVLAKQLVGRDIDVLVVACNTASSAALELLRAELEVPVIGMEPPLKPAVEASASGVVAVLATPGTARGDRLARLHERYAEGRRVFTLPMPGLADLVEAGEVEGERVERMLRDALDEPLREGVDAVALGCTHYGFLRPALTRLLPDGVRIIDAAEPVARRTLSVLEGLGFDLDAGGEPREVLCYATGDPAGLEATVGRLRSAGVALPALNIGRPVS